MSQKTQACMLGTTSLIVAWGSVIQANKFYKARNNGNTTDQIVNGGAVIVSVIAAVALGTLSWKLSSESSEPREPPLTVKESKCD